MTLNFEMRREDVLAFSREYHAASPTYKRTRARVRFTLPAILLGLWLYVMWTDRFSWAGTIIYLGAAVLWVFLYPARFDRGVQRYTEKTVDEPSYSKCLGPCELTISESGLQSKSNSGESTFYWSAVDRVQLTDSYCFIFLNGPIGYPIPIADVGQQAANDAYNFALARISKNTSGK